IHVTTVLSDVVPVQPLEPQWQRLFVGSVLNNVGFPLIGLVLIHLARSCCQSSRIWPGSRKAFSISLPPQPCCWCC
ncbi:MAG: hypothetical protein ACKO22_13575, partial [Cyanobium sp.]